MYRLIKGNIKQLVDQALLSEQGYIPQPTPPPGMGNSAPTIPPRMSSNSIAPYCPPGRSPQAMQRVTGTLFAPLDNDSRPIRAAELKNRTQWDEARNIDYEIFQEHLRSLGPDHASTLTMGYNLAEIELESRYLQKASEWCQLVTDNSRRVFGNTHALPLRSESLMGEILCHKGRYQEAESVCANVLARQQISIREDHLDTRNTRRRLAMAYNELKRRENAIMTAEKLVDTLKRLLEENHIRVFWAALDALDYVIYNQGGQSTYFPPDMQQAFTLLPQVHEELRAALGDRHPVALTLHGQGLARAHQIPEASETLRRALAISEDAFGPDHPQTMDIVGSIGAMYTLQGGLPFIGTNPATEAIPWLVRYLNWVEQRKGIENPEAITSLEMLGNIHLAAEQYQPHSGTLNVLWPRVVEHRTRLSRNASRLCFGCARCIRIHSTPVVEWDRAWGIFYPNCNDFRYGAVPLPNTFSFDNLHPFQGCSYELELPPGTSIYPNLQLSVITRSEWYNDSRPCDIFQKF